MPFGFTAGLTRGQARALAAARAGGDPRAISRALREAILHRDGYRCAACGRADGALHVDHIIPVVSGGTRHPENLRTLCGGCNLAKGARLPTAEHP